MDDIDYIASKANCRGLTSLFYPDNDNLNQIDRAKLVCSSCRVRTMCLDYALRTKQKFGVWGGKTEEERRHISTARYLSRRREEQASLSQDNKQHEPLHLASESLFFLDYTLDLPSHNQPASQNSSVILLQFDF